MPGNTIAACKPDDAAAAVPLIYSAGPAEFRYAFSVDYAEQALDFLHFAFTRDSGQFSYHNHTGIYVEGQLTGIAAYWTRADSHDFLRRNIADILAFYGIWKGAGVLLRGLHIEQVMPDPGRDCGFIANVGVAETARGQGLGEQLMHHQVQRAGMEQLKACELDVREGNPARRLYERMGFREQTTRYSKHSNRFGAINPHARMRLPL